MLRTIMDVISRKIITVTRDQTRNFIPNPKAIVEELLNDMAVVEKPKISLCSNKRNYKPNS